MTPVENLSDTIPVVVAINTHDVRSSREHIGGALCTQDVDAGRCSDDESHAIPVEQGARMNEEYLGPLKAAAEQASTRSIVRSRTAPRVGAAVLTVGGEIAIGAFLAGATASTTVHAEMAAIIAAVMGGGGGVRAVAVFASPLDNAEFRLVPCGNCLQFIAEHATSPDIVIATSTSALLPAWDTMTLASLLPRPWTGWNG